MIDQPSAAAAVADAATLDVEIDTIQNNDFNPDEDEK
eukprot:CAMPEP_0201708014 /NCGR_PEP_ID=MMETSP0578-20130828/54006_1 /ASSEMBLY_ACC=CAM_ASM_000663 /TAXON_ID=267565 /ORGANISM="Skeletonema grethea, Strain CCMP 1804" /LENGTH=36 /DNA_ID= /DNA_START= /DNA_END= /DNA_ORIENTATION=